MKLLNSDAFDLVNGVLAGARRFDLDAGSSRVMRLIFGSEADCIITPKVLMVHFGPKKQRHPNTYYRRVAPPIVSELMSRARVNDIARPIVLGLPAGDVQAAGKISAWSYSSKLVWVLPGRDVIKILVRTSPTAWRIPYVGTIPKDGTLALRELPITNRP